jgi:ribose transport system ATP-binding protein
LFGLVGAGRSELLRTAFGLNRRTAGSARLVGRGALARSARASVRAGVGLLSEDRKGEGLALELSVEDNLTLPRLAPYARGGWLRLGARRAAARTWMERVRCRARGPEQPVGELSGGNQQKVALARLLHQDARVLLLDEPTRGIDVGTKAEIYRWIGSLAAEGRAVVMTSSYLPELLSVCDRVGVLCRGRLVAVRDAARWTPEEVLHLAAGGAA